MKQAKGYLLPGDGDERHGLSGYTYYYCRCTVCRAAHSAYWKAYREEKHKALLDKPEKVEHGVYTTYVNYGCRCILCKKAMKIVTKERRRKKHMAEVKRPTICRMVEYRSRTGNYSVPAVITAVKKSLWRDSVEAGHVPDISSDLHVHLTVFTPGKPGKRGNAEDFKEKPTQPISENVSGCYQEWNIPYDLDGAPGTWRWPKYD